ncbi:uncharacterized protein [Misgurnus anguillicaudatus]|uniref:uncharacterized protein n=1 Tax=Misgurnus anguillicaudatus TaxID=75329 RepID=UPI003CCF78FA
MIKTWGKINGVNVDKKESSYPQDWLCEFQQLIDEYIERHFPIMPVESTTTQRSEQIEKFLRSTENMMFNEMNRLTTVLKDAGLLGYLIQSYIHHLFTKLNLLVNGDISVNETFCLLQWGKCVLFSPDLQDVFRACDPLLISGWLERAKQKILTILKDEISRVLQNILDYEEEYDEDNERSMDDEWFIRVHTDVTQCLIPVIQNANKFSPTLMNSVQILCLDELYSFIQKYVNGEMKRLENLQLINKKISHRTSNLRAKRNKLLETLQPLQANFVYLCKTISTCMKLRCLAVKISNLDENESVDVLKQLEDNVLFLVQNMMKHLAEVSLESYFEKSDEHIYKLTEEIEKQCESLPQTQPAEEIRTIIANLACNCVSRVYLDCLMKINFKKLQRRWKNVEERIRQDVQNLHEKFAQLVKIYICVY